MRSDRLGRKERSPCMSWGTEGKRRPFVFIGTSSAFGSLRWRRYPIENDHRIMTGWIRSGSHARWSWWAWNETRRRRTIGRRRVVLLLQQLYTLLQYHPSRSGWTSRLHGSLRSRLRMEGRSDWSRRSEERMDRHLRTGPFHLRCLPRPIRTLPSSFETSVLVHSVRLHRYQRLPRLLSRAIHQCIETGRIGSSEFGVRTRSGRFARQGPDGRRTPRH